MKKERPLMASPFSWLYFIYYLTCASHDCLSSLQPRLPSFGQQVRMRTQNLTLLPLYLIETQRVEYIHHGDQMLSRRLQQSGVLLSLRRPLYMLCCWNSQLFLRLRGHLRLQRRFQHQVHTNSVWQIPIRPTADCMAVTNDLGRIEQLHNDW